MKIRDVENVFKYRRIPYPKRSVELIALIAISCTFFLFMHTKNLNTRLREMEVKLQPSEFSELGLTGENHISGGGSAKHSDNINTLHKTYQYLKSTGQKYNRINANDKHVHLKHKPLEYANYQNQYHRYYTKSSNSPNKYEDAYGIEENEEEYVNEIDPDPSNADLLNNTKKAQIDIIFFNRVPKVGSQALMELMNRLGKVNNFKTTRDKGKAHETILMSPKNQRELITNMMSFDKPAVYSKHIAYINFTRFHLPKPIFINMIRDPIERIISWHYYIRAPWYYKDLQSKLGDKAPKMPSKDFMQMDFDTCVKNHSKYCQFNQDEINNTVGDHRRQTLFFCGQNKSLCLPFNSQQALQKAKRTVEAEYAVVGTWEDTNITLTVFEHYIPKFFKNAKVAYYLGKEQLSKINRNSLKREVSNEVREILRRNLTREIEFYEFCKQRLYMQYAALNVRERVDADDYVLLPELSENASENDDY